MRKIAYSQAGGTSDGPSLGWRRREFLAGTVGSLLGPPLAGTLSGETFAAESAARAGRPPAGGPPPLRIGFARVDITPTEPMPLAGFGARKGRPSEGAYQPLFVKALTLDDGAHQAVILCADFINWGGSEGLVKQVRELLKERYGLEPHQIVLNASHTHCGPALGANKYTEGMLEKVVGLVGAARARAFQARVGYGRGRSDISMYRRGRGRNGYYAGWYANPYGPTDHEVGVLKVVDMQGKTRAVVVNYACHPSTIVGFLFGGDYAGSAMHFIEQREPGAVALFLQGTGGDQKTRYLDPERPCRFATGTSGEGGPDKVHEFGRQLADAVSDVLHGPMQEVTGPIQSALAVVNLPLLKAPVDDKGSPPFVGPTRRVARMARMILDSVDENGQYQKTRPCEVCVLKIGPEFVFVGLSGEMCVRIGLRIKEQLALDKDAPRLRSVMVGGYTGMHIGYVPSMEMLLEKGYEAQTPYSLEMEDILVGKVMEMVG